MYYCRTPLSFEDSETGIGIVREIESDKQMLDNLVELIVFTQLGSFYGDPDFGFEYWNHEYSNNQFSFSPEVVKFNQYVETKYQDSIRNSLSTYAPQLKRVDVSITLNSVDAEKLKKKKISSKYAIVITVKGFIDNGLGTKDEYKKEVKFFIEPTIKNNI